MKLIAKKDFANNPRFRLQITDPKAPGYVQLEHANHIHKGCRFNFGTTEDYDGLIPDDKAIVEQLVGADAVLFDIDRNAPKIARLQEEVKVENELKARRAEAAKQPSLAEQIAAGVASALAAAAKK